MSITANSRKAMITLPASLLTKLDEVAARQHTSRSKLIRDAVESYLEEQKEAELRELLKAGYLARAHESLKISEEFFAAENEAWDRNAPWEE